MRKVAGTIAALCFVAVALTQCVVAGDKLDGWSFAWQVCKLPWQWWMLGLVGLSLLCLAGRLAVDVGLGVLVIEDHAGEHSYTKGLTHDS